MFSTKVNLLFLKVNPLYSAKLFAENFSKDCNLDGSVIFLPIFLSRANLKLHNIYMTPKMVKKVIIILDSSKASGPDCIPVMVLENREPELSYIVAQLFNICQKESCFPDCWKVSHWWSLHLKMLGKALLLKNIGLLVFFLWLEKSFKNL